MKCATCPVELEVVIGLRGRRPKYCGACRATVTREQQRAYQRRHYAMHKDALKLRRYQREEAKRS